MSQEPIPYPLALPADSSHRPSERLGGPPAIPPPGCAWELTVRRFAALCAGL